MTGGMAAGRSPGSNQDADRCPGGQETGRSPGGQATSRGPEAAGRSPRILAGDVSRGTKQTGKCAGLTGGVTEFQIALTYTIRRIFPHFKEEDMW